MKNKIYLHERLCPSCGTYKEIVIVKDVDGEFKEKMIAKDYYHITDETLEGLCSALNFLNIEYDIVNAEPSDMYCPECYG